MLSYAGKCFGSATNGELGEGWIAEEALFISIFASLLHVDDFSSGFLYAVNHSSDSNSAESITGNILDLINGIETIPGQWISLKKFQDNWNIDLGSEILFEVCIVIPFKDKEIGFGNSLQIHNSHNPFVANPGEMIQYGLLIVTHGSR